MKKMLVNIIILLLLLLPTVTFSTAIHENNIIYVDDDNTQGPWDGSEQHPYRFIQQAIDNASIDDTVFVKSGLYVENVFVDKPLHLQGQDTKSTVIDGGGLHDCIYLTTQAKGSMISRFTIQHSGNHSGGGIFDRGIDIHSDNTVITNNIISDHPVDAMSMRCANYNNISCNVIQNAGRAGIEAEDSRYNIFYRNTFRNNAEWGVMLHVGGISIGNKIVENVFIDNFKGMVLACQAGNEIVRNNFITSHGGHARSDFTFFSHASENTNLWNENYWDDWNSKRPRFISGFFSFDVDWHPCGVPYDFNGGI